MPVALETEVTCCGATRRSRAMLPVNVTTAITHSTAEPRSGQRSRRPGAPGGRGEDGEDGGALGAEPASWLQSAPTSCAARAMVVWRSQASGTIGPSAR